jgi:predicted small secreted protein
MKKLRLITLMLVAAMGLSACGADTSKAPEGVKDVQKAAFPVGSDVIINADHMPGMKGAKGKIVAAYDTTAYAVTYTPTTGGAPVTNHKWIIQEEIKNDKTTAYKPGTEVILKADHEKGMMDASAKIESAESTTVYMVDYTPTTGGGEVKNHKWVIESEIAKP